MPEQIMGATADPGASAAPQQAAKNGAEERIQQLVRQRNAAHQELSSLKEQVAELRGTVEAIRGQSPARNGESEKPFQSWQDLPDKDLVSAYKQAREGNNPELEFQAIAEYNRRQAGQQAKEQVETASQRFNVQRELQAVEQRIVTDFGAEAGNTDSELHARASQYAGQFRQRYGNDIFERTPDLAYLAFSKANHDLQSGNSDRIRELEAEVSKLRSLTSMEPGAAPGIARSSDGVREALAKHDPKAAIRALRATQSLKSH